MADVFSFPDPMLKAWRVYDRTLREALVSLPADEIEHVISVVKPIYLKHAATPFSLKTGEAPPEVAVARLNEWVHAITAAFMLEVIAREIELYRLGARSQPTSGPAPPAA